MMWRVMNDTLKKLKKTEGSPPNAALQAKGGKSDSGVF
jgi:hypothetical protein